MASEMKPETIAQTDEFVATRLIEPDGETTYHLDLNNVTVHFFTEEWDEFMECKDQFLKAPLGKAGTLAETENYFVCCDKVEDEFMYTIEMPGLSLFYFEEDFKAFRELLKDL